VQRGSCGAKQGQSWALWAGRLTPSRSPRRGRSVARRRRRGRTHGCCGRGHSILRVRNSVSARLTDHWSATHELAQGHRRPVFRADHRGDFTCAGRCQIAFAILGHDAGQRLFIDDLVGRNPCHEASTRSGSTLGSRVMPRDGIQEAASLSPASGHAHGAPLFSPLDKACDRRHADGDQSGVAGEARAMAARVRPARLHSPSWRRIGSALAAGHLGFNIGAPLSRAVTDYSSTARRGRGGGTSATKVQCLTSSFPSAGSCNSTLASR